MSLPFNYDNFKKLQDEVAELNQLVIRLTTQVVLQEAEAKEQPAKATKKK